MPRFCSSLTACPTYHLANVVDDHLMGITHVLRGEEWINSAPKHKLLYEYFGWEMPQLCHLPLLRNPDKSKLSKRKNPTSILYYQRMGYLPEALLNYLGRMGWSMPDEREKFSLGDMLDNFDVQRVSLGGPIFDVEKLSWLNGLWIREDLDDRQLAARLVEWAYNEENLLRILPHARKRMETLSDLAPLAGFLVSGTLPITEESFAGLPGEREGMVPQPAVRPVAPGSPAGLEPGPHLGRAEVACGCPVPENQGFPGPRVYRCCGFQCLHLGGGCDGTPGPRYEPRAHQARAGGAGRGLEKGPETGWKKTILKLGE